MVSLSLHWNLLHFNAMLTFHVKAITDRCSHFLYAVFPFFFFFFFTGLMLDVIDTMRNHASCNYLSNYSGFMWRRAQKSLSQFFPGRLYHSFQRYLERQQIKNNTSYNQSCNVIATRLFRHHLFEHHSQTVYCNTTAFRGKLYWISVVFLVFKLFPAHSPTT